MQIRFIKGNIACPINIDIVRLYIEILFSKIFFQQTIIYLHFFWVYVSSVVLTFFGLQSYFGLFLSTDISFYKFDKMPRGKNILKEEIIKLLYLKFKGNILKEI